MQPLRTSLPRRTPKEPTRSPPPRAPANFACAFLRRLDAGPFRPASQSALYRPSRDLPLPRPHLRLPDERARLRAHGGRAARGGRRRRSTAAEDADLIVFNTCSVREKAEQKLRSEVGKLAPLKRARPGVGHRRRRVRGPAGGRDAPRRGCVTSTSSSVPTTSPSCPRSCSSSWRGAPPVGADGVRRGRAALPDGRARARPGAGRRRFVTTMKGCDERCSFCIVPYTRGPERYRPAREVVAEVRGFVDAGVARGAPPRADGRQLPRPRALPPPESDDPDESAVPAPAPRHRARGAGSRAPSLHEPAPAPRHGRRSPAPTPRSTVLARHVHLPVQSGSDRVLRRMIRRYTRAEYVERVEPPEGARRPGLTLSTDIIVGFPGETEDDFAADALARARGGLRRRSSASSTRRARTRRRCA